MDKNSLAHTPWECKFHIVFAQKFKVTFPNAEVLEITKEGIKSVDYKDKEYFIVTKRFMDAPEKIIESLLGLD